MKKNSVLLLVLGFMMIAGGLYLAISTITPPSYQKATGTIMGGQPSMTSGPNYKRTISFVAQDGNTYTADDRSYSNAPQVSTEVTVAYNPNDPAKTMRVVSDSGRSTVWGVIVVVLGGVFVYMGFRKETPDQQLPQKR
ncbi:MAG: DUF3592 domain-containing protein [Candidatus Saccharimonadales bacterium]